MTFFRHCTGLEKEFLMASILSLDVAARTDIGRTRPTNEDNVVSVIPQDAQIMTKKGALFIAADGLGGKTKGDVASEMAVTTIRDAYYQNESDDILSSLQQAVEKANQLIYQQNEELFKDKDELEKKGMGTTCVAAVLKESTVYVANVGDSLAYIVHDSQVRQISQNHSWVAEQVRAGKMTLAEAKSQGKDNLIERCLGIEPDVKVYAASERVKDGDILILCTDGLHGLVSEEEMRTIVEQHGAEESATQLIARANENGGPDNITVVVARVTLA